MNSLPNHIIINLITEWPALAFVNAYTFKIYREHVKNKEYVTVDYYLEPCVKTLFLMCEKGKYIEIYKDNQWNYGFYAACMKGHLNIVKIMIEKGAKNLKLGLYYACKNGHLDVISSLIDPCIDNLDWGLSGACERGDLRIVKFMIRMGSNDWNWGLESACEGNRLGAVYLMIRMGAKNWNQGLYGACKGYHLNMAKLMIERGATKCRYCGGSRHTF